MRPIQGAKLLQVAQDLGAQIQILGTPGPIVPGDTGSTPLECQDFESSKNALGNRAVMSIRRSWADPKPAPSDIDATEEDHCAVHLGTVISPKRTRQLAAGAALSWAVFALLLVTRYLGLAPATRLLDALPFHAEALAIVPALLVVLTLLAIADAIHCASDRRDPGATRRQRFAHLGGWLLLAAAPGAGVLAGLWRGLALALDQPAISDATIAYFHRLAGWTLVVFTLAWQWALVVIVLTRA